MFATICFGTCGIELLRTMQASLSSGGDEFSSTSSALSSRSFECSVLKEGHRANRWKRRSLLVRAEVSEG